MLGVLLGTAGRRRHVYAIQNCHAFIQDTEKVCCNELTAEHLLGLQGLLHSTACKFKDSPWSVMMVRHVC